MKKLFYFTCSLLVLAFSSSVFAANDPTAATSPNTSANTQTANKSQDSAILGWIVVVDKMEIGAANAALKRNVSTTVKQYADLIKKDHSQNMKEAFNLGRQIKEMPMRSSASEDLKKKGKETMASFKTMNDHDFEVAFIDHMVTGHQDALNQIDQDLQNVTNPDLKTFLQNTRATVQTHLDKAKTIQDQLKSGSK